MPASTSVGGAERSGRATTLSRGAVAARGAEVGGAPALLAGSPAEHAAQAERDERRDHREEQDIDVGKALGHSGSVDARVAAAGDFADGARRSSWRKLRTRS